MRYIGIEMVALTNMLRRIVFHDEFDTDKNKPTSTQQWFLSYLAEHKEDGDIFQKDLEANFQIRCSTATEILKAMERKGLIVREPVSYDKRAKRIILTEDALKICEDNKTKILATEKELAKNLSDEELKTFFHLLDKIKQNIEYVEAKEQ